MFGHAMENFSKKILFVFASLLLWSAQVFAIEQIYLVVDVSGNIQRLDPQKKRITEIQSFINQLPNGSKAAVWTYAGAVNRLVSPGTVNDQWRQNAHHALATIGGYGPYSNVGQALSDATFYWRDNKKGLNRNVILITDSVLRPSSEEAKNTTSRSELETKLVPALQRSGVKVHVIAFDKADKQLYKQVAEQTQGTYQSLASVGELSKAFKNIQANLAIPVRNSKPIATETKSAAAEPVKEKTAEVPVENEQETAVQAEPENANSVALENKSTEVVVEEIVPVNKVEALLNYDHPPKPENIKQENVAVLNAGEVLITPETSSQPKVNVTEPKNEKVVKNTETKNAGEAGLITPQSTTSISELEKNPETASEAEEIRAALANAEAELSELLNEFAAMPKNEQSGTSEVLSGKKTDEPLVITLADGSILVTPNEQKAQEITGKNPNVAAAMPSKELENKNNFTENEQKEEKNKEHEDWTNTNSEGDIWPLILTILVVVNLVVILLLFIGRFLWVRHKRKKSGKSDDYF